MDTNQIGDAAAVFDPAAFRKWLSAEATPADAEAPGRKNQEHPHLAGMYDPTQGDAGWLVETLLDLLRGEPAVWALGAGVSDFRVRTTCNAEGPDGGLMAEVTVDRVPLSLGHIKESELIEVELLRTTPGPVPVTVAVERALDELADRISIAAEHFRSVVAG